MLASNFKVNDTKDRFENTPMEKLLKYRTACEMSLVHHEDLPNLRKILETLKARIEVNNQGGGS